MPLLLRSWQCHNHGMGQIIPTMERLERHIRREPSGCWIWTAHLNKDGYGTTSDGLRSDGTFRRLSAHRLMYELLVGSVPDGLQLDHLCRVRSCCNPSHLEPVTCRENLMRGINQVARMAAQTHCIRGHPFDEANTYRPAKGGRACRACARIRGRISDAKRNGSCPECGGFMNRRSRATCWDCYVRSTRAHLA